MPIGQFEKIGILLYNLRRQEALRENLRDRVSGPSAQKQYHYAFLVTYSEADTVIYIQRAQEEICAIFSGRNEAPVVRHYDRPS